MREDRRALRRAQFRDGIRSVLPSVLGTASWGVVTGISMVKAGLTVPQALAMTVVVYSGTAILATLPLLAIGASLPLIWLTALLANLRFLVYSAVIAGEFRRMGVLARLGVGHVATDTALAAYLGHRRGSAPPAQRMARYLGCTLPVMSAWNLGMVGGILLAETVPASPKLTFIGVLAVLALVGPLLRSVPAVLAAIAAAVVALLGQHWPTQGGMLAAIAAGVAVALLVERFGLAAVSRARA